MTGQIQIPNFLYGKKTFEQYKNEILAWQTITKIRKEDQGVYIALSLPDCDESKIREQVFESHGLEKLQTENGLQDLLHFMEKHQV